MGKQMVDWSISIGRLLLSWGCKKEKHMNDWGKHLVVFDLVAL